MVWQSSSEKPCFELEAQTVALDDVNRRRLSLHLQCIAEQFRQIHCFKLSLKQSNISEQFRLIACINLKTSGHQPALTVETRGSCLAQVIDRNFQKVQQRLSRLQPAPAAFKLTPNYAIAAAIKWCDD